MYSGLSVKQILVIEYSRDHRTKPAYETAYAVGKEIALHWAVLIPEV